MSNAMIEVVQSTVIACIIGMPFALYFVMMVK